MRILEDRKRLEELAGYPVRGMSYPFGDYSEELARTIAYLGIEYSRTVYSHGSFRLPDNFLIWHPTCHHDDNLLERCGNFISLPPGTRCVCFMSGAIVLNLTTMITGN